MVTRRARSWIRRGIAAGIAVAMVLLGVATWFTSEAIEEELLLIEAAEPTGTPLDAGIPFEYVNVPGPLGNYPAWQIAGEGDAWVVLIPAVSESLDQALELLPAIVEAGLPVLVISTRGAFGAPPAPGGHDLLGSDEWQDVEAAVRYLDGRDVERIVLAGYGTGGSASMAFLRRSNLSPLVIGLILDSPYLDPAATVDLNRAEDNVPAFLSGWSRALATFRWGVDWALLDQTAVAADIEIPILLFQGSADRRTPPEVADEFVAGVSTPIVYYRLDGVGHLGGFGQDPATYRERVGRFLEWVVREAVEEAEAAEEAESGRSGGSAGA